LGIGATTAIASAIDRALVQALPFTESDRLVSVYRTSPQAQDWPFSAPKYVDLARGVRQLSGLAALGYSTRLLARPEGGVEVRTIRVTGNTFPLLGVKPLYGRLINPADDSGRQNPVVVLGESFWRTRFAGDPAVVGQSVRLDGVPHEIIGVLPVGFHIPHGLGDVRGDLWVPIRFTKDELDHRGHNFLNLFGRLAPGATVASATADLRALVDAMVDLHPELRGESARATPLQADSVSTIRTPLLLVFAAVCLVLLIACANVGSLLLARGVHRQRELAVRTALGGTRWAIMRPAIAEGIVVASVGGLLGVGLAWLGVRGISTLAGTQLPQLIGVAVDPRIIAFAVILSGVVAILCSVMPALYSASLDPQNALRGGRGGGASVAQHRLLGGLVAAEVALSFVLLIGAGLVLRGFEALLHRNPGFDVDKLLTVTATISPDRYTDSATVPRFLDPAIQAIERIPGVEAAGAISLLPYREWLQLEHSLRGPARRRHGAHAAGRRPDGITRVVPHDGAAPDRGSRSQGRR
jgi:predicted permease